MAKQSWQERDKEITERKLLTQIVEAKDSFFQQCGSVDFHRDDPWLAKLEEALQVYWSWIQIRKRLPPHV